MQIIGGIARRIRLVTPPGYPVRPTLGRAREALFAALGDLSGLTILDIFAGTGALGLEALSRGGGKLLAVEKAQAHYDCILENIKKVQKAGVEAEIKVLREDALGFVSRYDAKFYGAFDLIFADPPYELSLDYFGAITGATNFIAANSGAKLIWEIPDTPGSAGAFLNNQSLKEVKLRKFGGTEFLIAEII